MRLLHLADYGGPHAGSFVPALCALSAAARREGSSVEAVLPTRARGRPWLTDLEQEGIPVTFLDPSPVRRSIGALRALVGDGRKTVVHTHFTAFDVAAVLAVRGRRVPVVWQVHTSLPEGPAARLRSALKHRLLGRRVALVLGVAEHIVEQIRSRGGARVRFVPNGIPIDRLALVEPDERARAKARLGMSPAEPTALHFGRHWEIKGLDLFLHAIGRLRVEGRPVHAIVIRGGEPVRALIAELGLEEAVRDVDSVVDIRTAYAVADVFASTSRHEGMPFTVLEALSCGVPVVATRIPGHVALAERCPGIELTALDPPAIAATLAAVLDRDPDETRRLLAEARAWIEAEATLEAWARRMLAIYAELEPR